MNRCYYCEYTYGVPATKKSEPIYKTIDHIIPLSKGGNNCRYNIIHACNQCNSLKGDRLLSEFSEALERMIGLVKKKINIYKSYKCFCVSRLEVVLKNTDKLIQIIEPYSEKLLKGYDCKPAPKNKPTLKQRSKMFSSGYEFSEILRHNEEIKKHFQYY